jgi:hypothetical protein
MMMMGTATDAALMYINANGERCVPSGNASGSVRQTGTTFAETDTVTLSPEAEKSSTSSEELTEEEKQQVAELKQRDREVRAHEAAHIAAGGGCVRGGATFSYQSGPDGKRYAVGGEVGIDTSGGKTPEETIRKMQTVRKAALAPASPSGTDRSVAAAAAAKEAQARQELSAQKMEEATGNGEDKKGKPAMGRRYGQKGEDRTPAAKKTVINLSV